MATLTAEQRRAIRDKIMRTADNCGGVTKPQLIEVVDALDDWWEASGSLSANGAIPQPQRGILTAKQKARLFLELLEARYGVA